MDVGVSLVAKGRYVNPNELVSTRLLHFYHASLAYYIRTNQCSSTVNKTISEENGSRNLK